jgi:uncharacterized membrane protein YqjE
MGQTGMDMKKLVGMEMVLILASILIFRSVWSFLDKLTWATSNGGLAFLLVVGLIVSIYALMEIHSSPK